MTDAGLQGRLSDFTLEEILQLIALQQKTGLLTVDASYPMILAFESGMLVGYRDRRRSGVDPLASFVKRYGFFTAESWEHIDFVARNSNLDLTEILVNEGLLTADELEAMQFEAAQEDVFRGMQLRDGRYHFLPGRDGMVGLKGRVRFKVDGLLMEAVRRIDEISSLRETFFTPDLKIRRTDAEIDESARAAPERRLLAALGRENTLGNLVAQGRMSEFDTLSTLEQMRADDIIQVLSTPRVEADAAPPSSSVMAARRRGSIARATVVGVTSVAIALVLAVLQPWSVYREAASSGADRGARWSEARSRVKVEAALQLFQQRHDRWPTALEELEADGWVTTAHLVHLQESYEYERGGGGYRLTPRPDPAD